MESTAQVQTKVAHVRIYTSGCAIKCQGTADLSEGENTILVDCLAYGTDEESIRVRMPTTVSLLSVATTHVDLPQQSEARSRLGELEREVDRLKTRIQNRTSQKELWNNTLERVGNQDNLCAIAEYLDQLPKHLDSLDDELASLQAELDRVQEDRDKIDDELQEIQLRKSRGLLQLRVFSHSAACVPLEIELRSSRASWRPVYDVVVDDLSASPRLRLRAEVSQNTGIEWEDVELTLSTAAPSLGGSQPRLLPLRLRKLEFTPRPRMGAKMMAPSPAFLPAPAPPRPQASKDDLGDTGSFDFSTLEEARAPQAVARELTNSVEYVVPGTWHIAKAGETTLVEVQTIRLAASYAWHAVPLLDDSVYMVAVLEDMLTPEAQGQEAYVYLEGEYCGKVTLDTQDDSDSHEISLGADARLHTTRRLVTRKATKTLLGGRLQEACTYELEVQNGRNEPVDVVLFDQVPISEEEEIAVQLGDCKGAQHDTETGELRWELNVPAHGAVKRRFSYTVSYPKGLQIDQWRDLGTQVNTTVATKICCRCGSLNDTELLFCENCGAPLR